MSSSGVTSWNAVFWWNNRLREKKIPRESNYLSVCVNRVCMWKCSRSLSSQFWHIINILSYCSSSLPPMFVIISVSKHFTIVSQLPFTNSYLPRPCLSHLLNTFHSSFFPSTYISHFCRCWYWNSGKNTTKNNKCCPMGAIKIIE